MFDHTTNSININSDKTYEKELREKTDVSRNLYSFTDHLDKYKTVRFRARRPRRWRRFRQGGVASPRGRRRVAPVSRKGQMAPEQVAVFVALIGGLARPGSRRAH